jgi:hypothetical protein
MKRPSRAATEVATMEHRELVVRAQAGDGDAFAALASAVVDRCYALAYRVLRDPDRAKDATQQALLGVWRDLPTLRELDRFDAWLHRLVVNACYAESRSNHRRQMRFRLLAVPPSDQRDLASSVADRGRNVELEHGGTHDDWSAVDGSGLIKHNDQPGEVDWALSNPISVYSDACAPGATLAAIGSSVNDLATALLDQTGSKANGPAGPYPCMSSTSTAAGWSSRPGRVPTRRRPTSPNATK